MNPVAETGAGHSTQPCERRATERIGIQSTIDVRPGRTAQCSRGGAHRFAHVDLFAEELVRLGMVPHLRKDKTLDRLCPVGLPPRFAATVNTASETSNRLADAADAQVELGHSRLVGLHAE